MGHLSRADKQRRWGGREGKNLLEDPLGVAQSRNQNKNELLTWRAERTGAAGGTEPTRAVTAFKPESCGCRVLPQPEDSSSLLQERAELSQPSSYPAAPTRLCQGLSRHSTAH